MHIFMKVHKKTPHPNHCLLISSLILNIGMQIDMYSFDSTNFHMLMHISGPCVSYLGKLPCFLIYVWAGRMVSANISFQGCKSKNKKCPIDSRCYYMWLDCIGSCGDSTKYQQIFLRTYMLPKISKNCRTICTILIV